MLRKIKTISIGIVILIGLCVFAPQLLSMAGFIYLPGTALAADDMQGISASANQALVQPGNGLPAIGASAGGNISLDFKDADIQNVLRAIALKGNVNIVLAKDVVGNVTVKLDDVSWEKALDVILKTYDFGYERQGNIITVTTMERLTAQKEAEKKLSDIQPLVSEIFTLKYIDADDLKETLKPQLSSRGTITVLKMTKEAGWQFSGGSKGESFQKLEKKTKLSETRSKTLIISDTQQCIEKIKKIIEKLDIVPQQVLIEARIIEVNEDVLKDIGVDWGTGSTGAESATMATDAVEKTNGEVNQAAGVHSLGTVITPAAFGPKATGLTAANTGLKFLYQRLKGNQFEVILHALQENYNANTLSAPRILTLNNQEATILVGTKYPILKSDISTQAGTTVTTTLDYYENIGIQLNVIPKISDDKYINMLIHPAVTSYDSAATVGTNSYPVISTREAETSVLLEDNQTIVIGGLLKDVVKKSNAGIPFLKNVPLLGNMFGRDTNDVEKVDLLIFITASIVRPEEAYTDEPQELIDGFKIEQEIIRERLEEAAKKQDKR